MTPYEQLTLFLSLGGYWFRISDKIKLKVTFNIIQNLLLFTNAIYLVLLLHYDGGLQLLVRGRFIYLPAAIIVVFTNTILLFKNQQYDKLLYTLKKIMQTDLEDRKEFQKFYDRLWFFARIYGFAQFMLWATLYLLLTLKEIVALIFGFQEFTMIPPLPVERIIGLPEGRFLNWLQLIVSLVWSAFWVLNYSSAIAGIHYFLVLSFIEFRIFKHQIKTHHEGMLVKDAVNTLRTIINKQRQLIRLFEDLQNASSLFLGIHNSLMALCICYFLHILTEIRDPHALALFIYGFIGFVLLTTSLCFFGDLIEEEGVAIYRALYDLPWHLLPPNERRSFTLILVQARRSLKITYKGILPTNLETYLQIMQASYSYLMLLKSI